MVSRRAYRKMFKPWHAKKQKYVEKLVKVEVEVPKIQYVEKLVKNEGTAEPTHEELKKAIEMVEKRAFAMVASLEQRFHGEVQSLERQLKEADEVAKTKAMEIKNAKAAVDAEWNKLEANRSWNLASVRPRKEVIAEAKAAGKHVHFGSLMDLCHEKHAETISRR